MSKEQNPIYHSPIHLESYDTSGPKRCDGEIGFVMDTLDAVLYAGGGTDIRPHAALSTASVFESHFSHHYYRGETSYLGLAWSLESITLGIDHVRYLGRGALKQSYKIKVDSEIHQASIGKNRVTTHYYLEEFAGQGEIYSGLILRPNITGNADQRDEPMTVYDCDQLYTLLDEIEVTIRIDKQDRAYSDQQ